MDKNYKLINKIYVPSTFALVEPHLFKPSMIDSPIAMRVSPLDFLDTIDKNITEEVDEIDIIFTSDLDDITFSHYMAQPKSMLCRKLLRNFFEKVYGNFDNIWLPNCFRNINT